MAEHFIRMLELMLIHIHMWMWNGMQHGMESKNGMKYGMQIGMQNLIILMVKILLWSKLFLRLKFRREASEQHSSVCCRD